MKLECYALQKLQNFCLLSIGESNIHQKAVMHPRPVALYLTPQ